MIISFYTSQASSDAQLLNSLELISRSHNFELNLSTLRKFQLSASRDDFNRLATEHFSESLLLAMKAEGVFPVSDSAWSILSSEVRVRELIYVKATENSTITICISLDHGIPCFGFEAFALDYPKLPRGFIELNQCTEDLRTQIRECLLSYSDSS